MTVAIVWLRRDLRLADNPALTAALKAATHVVPLYIHDESYLKYRWPIGEASRWWLHHSLQSLQASLRAKGSDLLLRQGQALTVLSELADTLKAEYVFWNRLYEPVLIDRDKSIKEGLAEKSVSCKSFAASMLQEPWQVKTRQGTIYQVYTPFWKTYQREYDPAKLHASPRSMPALPAKLKKVPLNTLELLPDIKWYGGLEAHWSPGEPAAQHQLRELSDDIIVNYPTDRDLPEYEGTSLLSPYLHFGELSPRQIYHKVLRLMQASTKPGVVQGGEAYLKQLVWRDFAHYLLFHFPYTVNKPLKQAFASFPWRQNYAGDLQRWQQGVTGIPIVDAGMRQLWHTGWMHNRVRMIVASLLTKNLLIPWQEGANWFWDTLLDADLANNTLGWQWVAGSGADAAPYFRIFNPVTQGERFDAAGNYVRTWLPELAKLPGQYIHKPWLAPTTVLSEANVVLGENYPEPIVDLQQSRQAALQAYQQCRAGK